MSPAGSIEYVFIVAGRFKHMKRRVINGCADMKIIIWNQLIHDHYKRLI